MKFVPTRIVTLIVAAVLAVTLSGSLLRRPRLSRRPARAERQLRPSQSRAGTTSTRRARTLIDALLGLAALAAVVSVAVAGLGTSSASFTTASTTTATASADKSSSWVHVYSKTVDPDLGDRAGYANQYGVTPTTPCAAGQDEATTIAMGRFSTWLPVTQSFTRVITLKTPAAFTDPAITQVRVDVSTVADTGNGRQPLQNVVLAPIGSAGGTSYVTLGVNQKVQLNLQVVTGWLWGWQYGTTYRPHIRLAISFTGSTGYFVYDFPVLVTLA